MLQDGYLSVLEARDRDEFLGQVVRFAKRLGFDTVSATTIVDHFLGEPEFISVDNAPASYRDMFEDMGRGRQDPVMQHCKKQSVPIIWSQETYVGAGQADLWDGQARFGYRTGVAMALHLPQGRHFFLGVDRDQSLPKDRSELTRIVADLQLFAVHAQEAAMRIMMPATGDPDVPNLTPREVESLRWTMEGKTAWEVGNILGISERTAVLHVNNAMHKLGCINKHQAVLKALRLGLIR
ncbi:autoinducer binding domain-containing protein [Piscinibacter sp.]|jgi:DNA-binding CsgD family transcriptional regulator|uniref:autoinducer binding domain-containing protein n=1 Tax=Piscinibacter sp. TaxID=1903157 RepID=UPI001B5D3CB8|nr:autoinducer binding domain-containing protein [Piscinibacter sp.]MBK7531682.1 autoinducer binding domain-containing protein [Piscinibacter sp.]MBP6542502.1 autoinducer binding domain-containing protein [Piscinibacter sp.]